MNASLYPPQTGRLQLSWEGCPDSESESGQSMLLRILSGRGNWSGWGIVIRGLPKKWIILLNTVDACDISRLLSTCCIIFSPFSLAVTAMFQTAAFFCCVKNIDVCKRIITLAPYFVHAVIRIGSSDFQKGALNWLSQETIFGHEQELLTGK